MGYTDTTLDNVRNADILKVVGPHVQDLKKKGANWFGLSPFKTERSPSFCVNPVKNNFVCYASGNSGDGIAFLMKLGRSFPEAVKEIAGTCGIVLQEENVSEEQIQRRERKLSLKDYATKVARGYMAKLRELDKDHWISKEIIKRQWNEDTITEFMLGYAPHGNVIAKAAAQKGMLEEAKTLQVVRTKDGSSYDFFRDRFMFPVQDHTGLVVGYGGRQNPKEDDKGGSKYMNSAENELYLKSKILYGYYQARNAMAKTSSVFLTEGYADVISMHQAGIPQTVATCGTALTVHQAKLLTKNVREVVLCRDGDTAGVNATVRDMKVLLPLQKAIYMVEFEQGDDPDSLSRKRTDLKEYLDVSKQDALLWYATHLFENSGDDVSAHGAAVKVMTDMLALVGNEITRNKYTKEVAKIYGVAFASFKKAVKTVVAETAAAAMKQVEDKDKEFRVPTLPDGCDHNAFLMDGFAPYHNTFLVADKQGAVVEATNFTMTPLFHVNGKENNVRLVELINNKGHKRIIDLEAADFVQMNRMKENLVKNGFFVFTHDCTSMHFMRIFNKILNDFIEAEEITVMGWQRRRFHAFSDGVFHNNEFIPVNKYGIVEIETEEGTRSEYQAELKHYYSPAYSEIYKRATEDDDPYENDRHFIYKKAPITLGQWTAQMKEVYGKKAHLGIAFAVATCFRDLTLKRFSYFPHIFLTGEKGSGKSKFGDSIVNLFFHKLPPFDLNSGTIVGFSRRLARVRNAPAFMEEFNDAIDDKMFQSLKGAFGGIGREKGMATNNNRTTITHVNSSVILAGQYHSSRDDNALTSRSIIMNFVKSTEPFTADQVDEYDRLKQWEEQGLSSLILDIIEHRPEMEKNYHARMVANQRRFKKDLKGEDYQERMLGNYNAMYTPIELLSGVLELNIDVEEFYNECRAGILDDSDLLVESEGLSAFWKVVEMLASKGMIKEGDFYAKDTPISVMIHDKKQKTNWKNENKDEIMYLQLTPLYLEYASYASKLKDTQLLNETTIRNYFKSKRYYIGQKKAHRFDHKNTSCFVFNYSMMQDAGVVNLTKTKMPATDQFGAPIEQQEIPEVPSDMEDDGFPL